MNYNTKDIFLERWTVNGTFEESPLRMQANSLIVSDRFGNLLMVDTSSFLAGTGSITISISSSVSDSASWAKQSVSSSYVPFVHDSLSSSYSAYADNTGTSTSASYVPFVEQSLSASYAIYADNSGIAIRANAATFAATASVALATDTASFAFNAVSASYSSVINVSSVSSASWASHSLSSSVSDLAIQSVTASYSLVSGVSTQSVTASHALLAEQSVSSSFAPIPLVYPMVSLASNQVSYSIDFSQGQYFQLTDTGSSFMLSGSLNGVAVSNVAVYIPPQPFDRTLLINSNWIQMTSAPIAIPATKTAVVSLTSFGSSESSVVFACGVQA